MEARQGGQRGEDGAQGIDVAGGRAGEGGDAGVGAEGAQRLGEAHGGVGGGQIDARALRHFSQLLKTIFQRGLLLALDELGNVRQVRPAIGAREHPLRQREGAGGGQFNSRGVLHPGLANKGKASLWRAPRR